MQQRFENELRSILFSYYNFSHKIDLIVRVVPVLVSVLKAISSCCQCMWYCNYNNYIMWESIDECLLSQVICLFYLRNIREVSSYSKRWFAFANASFIVWNSVRLRSSWPWLNAYTFGLTYLTHIECLIWNIFDLGETGAYASVPCVLYRPSYKATLHDVQTLHLEAYSYPPKLSWHMVCTTVKFSQFGF